MFSSKLAKRSFAAFTKGSCISGEKSKFTTILGAQWGDEGKGKLVDILAKDHDLCARFNGGANAGHTIVVDKVKYALHLLPCGIMYDHCQNLLGNGVVVNIPGMFGELKQLDDNGINYTGRLKISTRAHLVSKIQMQADGMDEERRLKKAEGDMIGTTKQGIGPTYASKALRIGLRAGDLADWTLFKEKYNTFIDRFEYQFHITDFDREEELDQLFQMSEQFNGSKDRMLVDSVDYVRSYLDDPTKRIIAEGANATMLDLDFGTWPYVTSSSTCIGGVCTGLGVPPSALDCNIGIVKAYTTRVGAGPFPTWLDNEIGERLQDVGNEFGATTGRKRKCGWLDLNVIKYSNKLNGFSSLNITKLDVLSGIPTIKVATHYELDGKKLEGSFPAVIDDLARCETIYQDLPGWTEDLSTCTSFDQLPRNAQDYINFIEEQVKVPVSWIGTGPEREAMFLKEC